MNKEEFKQRILCQFKDKSSPINLMATLYENSLDVFHQNISARVSWVKEYGLLMTVETIGDDVHQVKFIDCDSPPSGVREFLPSGYDVNIFAKERVYFKGPMIYFELRATEIEVKDYFFTIKEPQNPDNLHLWAYDIPNRKLFCCASTGEIAGPYNPESLDKMDLLSVRNNSIYETVSVFSGLILKAIQACKDAGVSNDETDEVIHCFHPEAWEGFSTRLSTILNKFYHFAKK
jgi:hypothetical protein